MLNRESVFRGEAALTARQRQTVVFVGGIVAVLGAIVLSFTGAISALLHRDDPVAMQAVAADGTATTGTADQSADAGFDLVAPDLGGAESGAGAAAAPGDPGSAPVTGGGRFTGTYKPSKGGAPSPLSPTATTAAADPAGDPGSTAVPTTQPPAATTASTADAGTSTTATTSSSTTTTRAPTTTTTTSRVTVTEATVPPTVITTPSTRPPTTEPPTTAPPSSPVIPGPVA